MIQCHEKEYESKVAEAAAQESKHIKYANKKSKLKKDFEKTKADTKRLESELEASENEWKGMKKL